MSLRSLLAAAAVLPLYFSPCDGPTEPREQWQLNSAFGSLEVYGAASHEPALRLGLDGGPGTASALEKSKAAMLRLGRDPRELVGALGDWSILIREETATFSVTKRILYVDGRGPEAVRYSAGHEAQHALCHQLKMLAPNKCDWVDHCGVFGPGWTLGGEPC